MKNILLLCLCVVAAGCAQAPLRAGNIVIHPFETAGFKTSNPVDINDRVVSDVRDALHKQLLKYTKEDSALRVVDTCSPGGDELKGKILEISTETDHQYRLVVVKQRTQFKVDIEAFLYRCGSTAPFIDISEDVDDENMIDVVGDLAEAIVDKIRKDKTIAPVVAAVD